MLVGLQGCYFKGGNSLLDDAKFSPQQCQENFGLPAIRRACPIVPMHQRRTYQVPETRLPFVNGEIAQVDFKGSRHLVSAIWGGSDLGGRIYLWNPDTGSHHVRPLPRGVPGAYMLKTASDGRLYLGCGNGDLVRFDADADEFETLVSGQLHSITWGGCVTDRLVMWTASPGDAVVYDWRAGKLLKKFSPLDQMEPHALYGHNALEAPDGKILVILNSPQARIVVIDPADLSARSFTPEGFGGAFVGNPFFIDANSLMVITAGNCFILRYPGFELIERIDLPENCQAGFRKGCAIGNDYYALFDKPAGLWRFRTSSHGWEQVIDDWSAEDGGYLGLWQDYSVARVTVTGIALTYDTRSGKTSTLDLEAWGRLDPHAMCAAPSANLIIGAPFINSSFWTIDTKTGEGKHRGRAMPGGGQINQIVWDSRRRRALLSAYTAAAITEYDPSQPVEWPKNPRLVASAAYEHQMRPMALLFDGRYAWMATSPEYGLLGGALSRIDPETNQIKVWRNIVPDQTINALVYDKARKRIYCSSEIWADCDSCPPTQTTAEVVAFDASELRVLRKQTIQDGVPKLRVVCMLPDGNVLVSAQQRVWSWNPDDGDVTSLGEIANPPSGVATASDGTIWASMGGAIGKLELRGAELKFTPKLEHLGGALQIVDNTLWYAIHTDIHAVRLAELANS